MFIVLDVDYSSDKPLAVFTLEEDAKIANSLGVGDYYVEVYLNPSLEILKVAKKFFMVRFFEENPPFICNLPNYKIDRQHGITLVQEEFKDFGKLKIKSPARYQVSVFADTDQEALELAKQKLNERGIVGVRV